MARGHACSTGRGLRPGGVSSHVRPCADDAVRAARQSRFVRAGPMVRQSHAASSSASSGDESAKRSNAVAAVQDPHASAGRAEAGTHAPCSTFPGTTRHPECSFAGKRAGAIGLESGACPLTTTRGIGLPSRSAATRRFPRDFLSAQSAKTKHATGGGCRTDRSRCRRRRAGAGGVVHGAQIGCSSTHWCHSPVNGT